jgi:hypothetical protein
MIYAQIKNGQVHNKILVDDENKVHLFAEGFDHCIRIDNLKVVPDIDWFYKNNEFTKVINLPIEGGIPAEVPHGTAETFKPFKMSQDSFEFDISLEGENLIVGCQVYNFRWIRYAVWMMKTKNADSVGPLFKTVYGLTYKKKITIVQIDIDAAYAALCTLRK